jgi:hypothetical protein
VLIIWGLSLLELRQLLMGLRRHRPASPWGRAANAQRAFVLLATVMGCACQHLTQYWNSPEVYERCVAPGSNAGGQTAVVVSRG